MAQKKDSQFEFFSELASANNLDLTQSVYSTLVEEGKGNSDRMTDILMNWMMDDPAMKQVMQEERKRRLEQEARLRKEAEENRKVEQEKKKRDDEKKKKEQEMVLQQQEILKRIQLEREVDLKKQQEKEAVVKKAREEEEARRKKMKDDEEARDRALKAQAEVRAKQDEDLRLKKQKEEEEARRFVEESKKFADEEAKRRLLESQMRKEAENAKKVQPPPVQAQPSKEDIIKKIREEEEKKKEEEIARRVQEALKLKEQEDTLLKQQQEAKLEEERKKKESIKKQEEEAQKSSPAESIYRERCVALEQKLAKFEAERKQKEGGITQPCVCILVENNSTDDKVKEIYAIFQSKGVKPTDIAVVNASNDYELASVAKQREKIEFPFVLIQRSAVGTLEEVKAYSEKIGVLEGLIAGEKVDLSAVNKKQSTETPPELKLGIYDYGVTVGEYTLKAVFLPIVAPYKLITWAFGGKQPELEKGEELDVMQSNWYWRHQLRTLRFTSQHVIRLRPGYNDVRAMYKYEDIKEIKLIDPTYFVISYREGGSDWYSTTPTDVRRICDIICMKNKNVPNPLK